MLSNWHTTCRNLNISEKVANLWCDRIKEKLSTNRFYHSWDELLYYEFDVKKNCVEKNCNVFREFCMEANLKDANVVKRVLKLLGDLSIEDIPEYEEDANVFQDLDLIVLGSSADDYKKYTELIRKEYSHLSDADFKKMRLKGETRNGVKFRKIFEDKNNCGKRRKMNRAKFKGKNKRNSVQMRPFRGIPKASHNVSGNNDCYIIENIEEIIVINDDEDTPKPIDACNDSEIIVMSHNEDEDSEQFPIIIDSTIIEDDLISDSTAKEKSETLNKFALVSKDSQMKDTLSFDCPIIEDRTANVEFKNVSLVENKNVPKENESLDDSVIFVNEEIDLENFNPISKALDYIPLSSSNENLNKFDLKNKNQISHNFHTTTNSSRRNYKNLINASTNSRNVLFSSHEKKLIEKYSTNAYNPNKEEKTFGKRMVIIDGSNIAYAHSLNKVFSVKGLEICILYFEKMGHEVKAVVPQNRLQKDKSTDPEKLETLHRAGKIVFTPCKNLPGKSSTSYDDRFILQLAAEFDAAIISNDNYRDLIHENAAFKKLIENRVVGYTWCKDMFILPKDPYGRNGPGLSVILNYS